MDGNQNKEDIDSTKNFNTTKFSKLAASLGYAYSYPPYNAYDQMEEILKDADSLIDFKTRDNQHLQLDYHLEEFFKALKFCFFYNEKKCRDYINFHPQFQCYEQTNQIIAMRYTTRVCNVMLKIIKAIDPKESYNLFNILMTKTTSNCYNIFDTLIFVKNNSFYKSSYVDFNKLFTVLKVSAENSKSSLSFAESKKIHGLTLSFTPFSMQVAKILQDNIETIIAIMNFPHKEFVPGVFIKHIMELLVTLITSTPFNRMKKDLLNKVLKFVHVHLKKRPEFIPRIHLNIILNKCFSGEGLEISDLDGLMNRVPYIQQKGLLCSQLLLKSYRFIAYWASCLIECSRKMSTKFDLATKDFKLMKTMVTYHFDIFILDASTCLELITDLLLLTPYMETLLLKVYPVSSKFFTDNMNVIQEALSLFSLITEKTSYHYTTGNNIITRAYLKKFINSWEVFISQIKELSVLKSSFIALSIPECFIQLNTDLHSMIKPRSLVEGVYFCLGLMSLCKRNENAAKAARAVTHFSTSRHIMENPKFFVQILTIVEESINSDVLNIRMSYSWALGNLSDGLIEYYMDNIPHNIDINVAKRIYEMAFKCSADKPAVAYNAYRTIGNLFQWLPLKFLGDSSMNQIIKNGFKCLENQMGEGTNFKNRWNASHAVGNAIQNKNLVTMYPETLMVVVDKGSYVAYKSSSLKERIQCLKNLKLLCRGDYKNKFFKVLIRTLMAYYIPAAAKNEAEMIAKLYLELSLALCHFFKCFKKFDAENMDSKMVDKINIIKFLIEKGNESGDLEALQEIGKAHENLESILELLTDNEQNFKMLEEVCEIFRNLKQKEEKSEFQPLTEIEQLCLN